MMCRCLTHVLVWVLVSLSLALGLTGVASAQPQANNDALATTRQLLDWLGVDGLLEQTPQIVDQILHDEARFHDADNTRQAEWRRQLASRLNSTTLRERVARRVASETDPQTLQRALNQLQMPLPKRARYFELALTQPGAGGGFREFRSGLEREPPAPARQKLIRAIAATAGTAALQAQWQTAINAEVQRLADTPPPSEHLLDDMVQERQRHLAPLAEVYALYAYRYLTDAELETYRDTLSDAAIQRVLDACRRNLAQALMEDHPG